MSKTLTALVDRVGNVTSAYNFDWRGVSVQERLATIAPAVVESDVRAAALAEACYGAGAQFNLFCYVTVGTGISYCFVQEGKPLAGARGNALVLASMPLPVRDTTVPSFFGRKPEMEIAASMGLSKCRLTARMYNCRPSADRLAITSRYGTDLTPSVRPTVSLSKVGPSER